MKKAFLLSAVLFIGLAAFSQDPRDTYSPRETVQAKNISVAYGRAPKRDRMIFGVLVPYGKVWRCGANEATEITFAKDGTFGGKPIKAGTYTLFVIPEKTQWTIILNSQLGQWGAYKYDQIKGKDVLQVKAPVKTLSKPVERLTFSFPPAGMSIVWDQTEVVVPVKIK